MKNVEDACVLSSNLIDHLLALWTPDVHVYNINVPLMNDVLSTRIYFTRLLENRSGSLFRLLSDQENQIHEQQTKEDAGKTEQKLREEGTTQRDDDTDWHDESEIPELTGIKRWQWSVDFKGLDAYVAEHGHKGGGMTDGWCINQRWVSVTALRAAFQVVDGGGGNAHGGQEIVLDKSYL